MELKIRISHKKARTHLTWYLLAVSGQFKRYFVEFCTRKYYPLLLQQQQQQWTFYLQVDKIYKNRKMKEDQGKHYQEEQKPNKLSSYDDQIAFYRVVRHERWRGKK